MMKNILLFAALCLVLFSCDTTAKKTSSNPAVPSEETSTHQPLPKGLNNFTLYEGSFGQTTLPFPEQEMLPELARNYPTMDITKEIGYQDGPDFLMYSFDYEGKSEEENITLKMNDLDTFQLDAIIISSPIFKDEYGVKPGDDISSIKKLRKGKFRIFVADHFQTYVLFDDSRIHYHIRGDFENNFRGNEMGEEMTMEQVKGAKVFSIEWRRE